jgi:Acetyltransferases
MQIKTKNGEILEVRRVQPSDAPLMVRFFHGLSYQTRWRRFLRTYEGISPLWIRREARRIARIRPQRQIAFIALWTPPHRKHQQMVAGVQVIRTTRDGPEGEFAIVVADAFQRQGIGVQLTRIAFEEAKKEGITEIVAYMHADNTGIWRTLKAVGYPLHCEVGLGERIVRLSLLEEPVLHTQS